MFYKIILFTFMVTISESFIFHQRHMKVHVSITNNLQLPTHIINIFFVLQSTATEKTFRMQNNFHSFAHAGLAKAYQPRQFQVPQILQNLFGFTNG